MPRPPLLKNTRIVPIVFEAELYEELKREAQRQGKSVSQLIREISALYLSKVDSNTKNPHLDNSQLDPVVEGDIEDFYIEVCKLEKAIEKTTLKYRGDISVKLANLQRAYSRLKEEYYKLKRTARNNSKLVEAAEKLSKCRYMLKTIRDYLVL